MLEIKEPQHHLCRERASSNCGQVPFISLRRHLAQVCLIRLMTPPTLAASLCKHIRHIIQSHFFHCSSKNIHTCSSKKPERPEMLICKFVLISCYIFNLVVNYVTPNVANNVQTQRKTIIFF